MSKIITLLFWRRPQYAQQVLEYLSRCDGIEDYKLIIEVDGPPITEMKRVCAGIKFAPADVHYSGRNMGCNHSTRVVLRRGFIHSDYVIHVEEDVILAPDALRYFEWAKQFGTDQTLLTIAALRHPHGWLYENGTPFPLGHHIESKVEREGAFSCWGWSTWKDRWLEMEKNWSTDNDRRLSWDVRLEELRRMWKKSQLMPHVSRIMNIGKDGGVHRGDYLLSYWAGSQGFIAPKDYFIVT